MTTQHTEDRADADLRAMLADADPVAEETGASGAVPAGLLDRVLSEITDRDPAQPEVATAPSASSSSYPRRHWQGLLWAAASVATIALAAGTLLPGLVGGSSADDTARTMSEAPAAMEGSAGGADAAVAGTAPVAPADPATSTDTAATADTTAPALARTATVLAGTDDIDGARDRFVADITAMGGRVMSESVVTDSGGVTPVAGGGDATVSSDVMYTGSYPYPWYPSGPGVWLSVEVPVAEYDRAVAAAQASGQVVRLEQTTMDVTAQQADVNARVTALEASLARLTALLGQATSISDVVTLEDAIATRQAELDSLRAQQADLASQTQMSRVSLTLMSPDDAEASVSPTAPATWWESFLAGLEQWWAWLGKALLIVSPLLLAGAIVAWTRRRHHRNTAGDLRPAAARDRDTQGL